MPRLPSAGTVLGTVAIVLSLGGSATAALLEVTGDNVRDGSLTGKDIRNNSIGSNDVRGLGSQDIKDGRIRTEDIKNGTIRTGDLSEAAQADLKGNRGPRGPAGLGRLDYRQETATAGGRGRRNARVDCAPGDYPVGGGMEESSGALVLTSSGPTIGTRTPGWRVSVANFGASDKTFRVYAICTDAAEVE